MMKRLRQAILGLLLWQNTIAHPAYGACLVRICLPPPINGLVSVRGTRTRAFRRSRMTPIRGAERTSRPVARVATVSELAWATNV